MHSTFSKVTWHNFNLKRDDFFYHNNCHDITEILLKVAFNTIILHHNKYMSSTVNYVQHYVIKFISDLRHVSDFLRVLRFLSPIKPTATIYSWNIVESGGKHHKATKLNYIFRTNLDNIRYHSKFSKHWLQPVMYNQLALTSGYATITTNLCNFYFIKTCERNQHFII